ncbi:hypothetical protein EDEG_03504 [Edhazardia aedis USNM 41457]|uniref:Uncharacterized protein n=1 Tax=Edhazardia aedis (strain USNM 41457) TaxID=1003232 RepID=J9D3E0_EDHAE|nr:hypothetical protein EDEG_03504 [Edhazardia aedis USNM 41457]|eukprot:EJW02054.1 hypothetical protein EDEG_03504 [Edhazardia aedis USNM 41457]
MHNAKKSVRVGGKNAPRTSAKKKPKVTLETTLEKFKKDTIEIKAESCFFSVENEQICYNAPKLKAIHDKKKTPFVFFLTGDQEDTKDLDEFQAQREKQLSEANMSESMYNDLQNDISNIQMELTRDISESKDDRCVKSGCEENCLCVKDDVDNINTGLKTLSIDGDMSNSSVSTFSTDSPVVKTKKFEEFVAGYVNPETQSGEMIYKEEKEVYGDCAIGQVSESISINEIEKKVTTTDFKEVNDMKIIETVTEKTDLKSARVGNLKAEELNVKQCVKVQTVDKDGKITETFNTKKMEIDEVQGDDFAAINIEVKDDKMKSDANTDKKKITKKK